MSGYFLLWLFGLLFACFPAGWLDRRRQGWDPDTLSYKWGYAVALIWIALGGVFLLVGLCAPIAVISGVVKS